MGPDRSACGADAAAGDGARHGLAVPRGQDPLAGTGAGRFGRMFPGLEALKLTDAQVDALVACAKGRTSDNRRVPAGYTYLGQFVDHDLTFDPVSSLDRANDPHALENFRTPRLDLDSLYGSGPADEPFLYDWCGPRDAGVKLLVGRNPDDCDAAVDLPRNQQGRALLGDARNDENLIVAQLHLLFIRFHNKVVDRVRKRHPRIAEIELFARAQQTVRWHYQWIVVHDFLSRILPDDLYASYRARADGTAPAATRWLSAWRDAPFMPVEFSGAAYRLGHSMVRPDYNLNDEARRIPIFRRSGQDGDSLAGFRRLPAHLVIDWSLFFFALPAGLQFGARNVSTRIDTVLVAPLLHLPGEMELARLNLERGVALGLPAGPDVARELSVQPIGEQELMSLEAGDNEEISLAGRATLLELRERLPLWTYVLLEARLRGTNKGQTLGPVGGQIVAEVLLGLLEADPHSYLGQRPAWTPELSDRADGDFAMVDLVRYVEDPDWL